MILERDADCYYVASVPALPGCHTQGRTLDGVHARIHEAIELCLREGGQAAEDSAFVGAWRVVVASGH